MVTAKNPITTAAANRRRKRRRAMMASGPGPYPTAMTAASEACFSKYRYSTSGDRIDFHASSAASTTDSSISMSRRCAFLRRSFRDFAFSPKSCRRRSFKIQSEGAVETKDHVGGSCNMWMTLVGSESGDVSNSRFQISSG